MSAAHTPESRVKAIKARQLEIQATLTEWKRAYFVEGISRPMADRATLEAEYAQLALERNTIEAAAQKARFVRHEKERASLLYQLIAVLRERGMADVMAEAQARADQREVAA